MNIPPVWEPVPALMLFALMGIVLDRVFRLQCVEAGVAAWPLRVALGLATAYAWVLHPLTLVPLAGAAWIARSRVSETMDSRPKSSALDARWFAIALVILAMVMLLRPTVPLYWDEFVWLEKAKLEARSFGALRAAALSPAAGLIPTGYPMLFPLVTAWFTAMHSDASALLVGSVALKLLATAMFLGTTFYAWRAHDGNHSLRDLAPGLVLLIITPIVVVHARAMYVDLPSGLFAASAAMALSCVLDDDTRARSMVLIAAVSGLIITGGKDEGFAHVLAIALAFMLAARRGRNARTIISTIIVLGVATIPFVTWKVLLLTHHVADTDHALGRPDFAALPQLIREIVRHASDVHTWGAFWAVVFAALIVVARRPTAFASSTRAIALSLLLQTSAIVAGIIFGPDRVRVFAFEGTLLNRVLVQVAPMGALVVSMVLRDVRAKNTRSRSLPKTTAATMSMLVLSIVGCSRSHGVQRAGSSVSTSGIVVVAPHPDDEVLIAAGVIRSARLQGRHVTVVIVTNGDYTCERNGWIREQESVAALGLLGVPESDVHFLGYPDGHLRDLRADVSVTVDRRDVDGRCIRADTTYGNRGARHLDEHTARTGHPAHYTSTALVEDLAAVLNEANAPEIYVTHSIDGHPDHSLTYAYVRRALEHTTLGSSVRIHRAIVHAGACWPNGRSTHEPCPSIALNPSADIPALPDPLASYVPTERVSVPREMLTSDPTTNLKYRAIASYPSQTGPEPLTNWLTSFARSQEGFYVETLVHDDCGPSRLTRQRTQQSVRVRFVARCSGDGAFARIRFAETGSDEHLDGYIALIQANPARVSLSREHGTGTSIPIRDFLLPIDGGENQQHAIELAVDPRPDDGGVTEITLIRDGELLGVAIDPTPIILGTRASVENHSACELDAVETSTCPRGVVRER